MKKSLYRLIIAPLVSTFVIIFIAYYSVGVVERSSARRVADMRIEQIISRIDENNKDFEAFKEQLRSEYESRAKSFSLIISQTPTALTEDMATEELRLAIGADEIALTNSTGHITFSTSESNDNKEINEQFLQGLKIKNFSGTLVTKSDDGYIFEVAVSRRDGNGLLIFKFINTSLNDMLNYSGIASVTSDYPMMQNGITAIVDIPTNTYLSHTTSKLNGTLCTIPPEKFINKEKDSFSYKVYGNSSLVCFKTYEDNIILGILPKSEIYQKRNSITGWLSLMAAIVIISMLLSIRQYKILNK